jgi:hypothetical protein
MKGVIKSFVMVGLDPTIQRTAPSLWTLRSSPRVTMGEKKIY